MAKRYYWMKLKPTFFDKRVKALRRMHGADAIIIYQKLIIHAIEGEEDECGIIRFGYYLPTLADEIAEDIQEDADAIQGTIDFLVKHDMAAVTEENDLIIYTAAECVGRESEAAERVRRFRARQQTALQSNGQALQSNGQALQSNANKEKEIETKKEIDTEDAQASVRLSNEIRKYVKGSVEPSQEPLAILDVCQKLNGMTIEEKIQTVEQWNRDNRRYGT